MKCAACRCGIPAEIQDPEAKFRVSGGGPAARLLDYWQWSGSSLMANTARGVLAEFIVATALDLTGKPRREWEGHDLQLPCGAKIEVKSSARVQSWPQNNPSRLEFGIARRKLDGASPTSDPQRWADIYVFCTLESCSIRKHSQALDTDEWRFYVVDTCSLEKEFDEQKRVTLGSLKKRLEGRLEECCYSKLKETIEAVACAL